MVILPKNHILQDNSLLNNDKELVFFKDSYYKGRSIPNLMKFLFQNKMVVERNLKEGEEADNQNLEIGGDLDQAEIIEQKGKDIIQQVEGYDCGWWAVYNALMFIAEGNDSFLDKFDKASTRESGYKLRGIFINENLSLTAIGDKQKSHAQDNNLWVGLEESLHASLIETLKKEDGFEELKEEIEKLDNDYLGMLSFIQGNEGAKLEESYRTVMDIIKDYNQGMPISQGFKTPKKKFNLDNKWPDYVESSQLKEKVIKEYAGMLKKDVVLDQTYDDFIEFVSSGNIYVDKSLFIKHVLDNGNHLLITCPRRWGKSLNLSMLKAFLQPDGEDETHYTEYGKYDFTRGSKNAKFFKKLDIAIQKINQVIIDEDGEKKIEESDIAHVYQGQYPVIYLNLKGAKESSGGSNKDEGYTKHNLDAKLRTAVSDAYKEHKYLYKSKLLHQYLNENISLLDNYSQKKNEVEEQLTKRSENITDQIKTLEEAIKNISGDLKKLKAYYNSENIAEAPIAQSIKYS